jgi:uncharacterized protein involved in exopolysaccharide biosynthesis
LTVATILIVVVCAVIGAGAAYWHASRSPNQYQATAVLAFGANQSLRQLLGFNDASVNSADAATVAATNVQLASLPIISQMAASRLPQHSFGGASPNVSVAEAGASSLVNVTATEPTPAKAADGANAYAAAFISYVSGQQSAALANAIAGLKRTTRTPRTDLAQLEALRAAGTLNVSVAQRASPPDSPSSPKPTRDTLLGLLLGLVIGLAAAAVVHQSFGRLTLRRSGARDSGAAVEEST